MNVVKYLQRIGYCGSLKPTLYTLRDLTKAHKTTIPYSNVGVHKLSLEGYTTLDLETNFRNLITRQCGGMCYETNSLFVWLLKELGFDAYIGKAASYISKDKYSSEYSHLAPIIIIEGVRYIVDMGWTLFGPMKLEHMTVYSDNFNVYRIRKYPGKGEEYYILEIRKKKILNAKNLDVGKWIPVHIINTKPTKLEDFKEYEKWCLRPDSFYRKQIFLVRYQVEPIPIFHIFTDHTYNAIQAIDDHLDKILLTKRAKKDQNIKEIVNTYFKFNITEKVSFFEKAKQ